MMSKIEKSSIAEEIIALKKERNAVILTHNYQLAEVQEIADFVGDSLELSIKASETEAEIIVFCGVKFMAETAYILSPDKTVLLPSLSSGCPMADMADAESLSAMKKKYPDAVVVTYVNSSADVKALSDICVTSSNALNIVRSIPEDKKIIFVPDRNLGKYIQYHTGRDMILWEGYCPVHMRISPEALSRKKEEYPEAVVVVHPESQMDVIKLADIALSTGGMLQFAKDTLAETIIVATEIGMLYRLQKENPDIRFVSASEQAVCPDMKMHTLEDVLDAIRHNKNIITVPEPVREKAYIPIKKMLDSK
jgi:quinolinate synthase